MVVTAVGRISDFRVQTRTKSFALDILDFVDSLPVKGTEVRIGYQLANAATSVAANYRASCRSRSDAEFAAKIGVVLEESDESLFWLEICEERTIAQQTNHSPPRTRNQSKIHPLKSEL